MRHKCAMCGQEFGEQEGAKACSRCTLFGGCRMVMCPKCGYEMPVEPKLLKALRSWLSRKRETIS